MLFADTRRFLFQKKRSQSLCNSVERNAKMPVASSLSERLKFLKDAVQQTKERLPIVKWFQDRTPHVDGDKLLRSDLYEKVYGDFAKLLTDLQAQVAVIQQDNRITFSEAVSFIGSAIQQAYVIVSKYAAHPADRKELVLILVDEFYAKVLAPLDIPYVPAFAENSFLDPMLGKALHYGAEGLYDVIVGALLTSPPLQASNLGSPSPHVGSVNPNP